MQLLLRLRVLLTGKSDLGHTHMASAFSAWLFRQNVNPAEGQTQAAE